MRSAPLARTYSQSFTAATGLPLTIQEPGQYCLEDCEGIPAYCLRMASRNQLCKRCLETHVSLQRAEGPTTIRCFAGLTSSAVPVVVKGEAVAYLHTGHACVDGKNQPSPDVPQLSSERYQGALRLLEFFSHQLADSVPDTPQGGAYPAIDRIAREVRQFPDKPWRLAAVARSVNMHPSYFSEMFHQRLGVTFTEFVSHVRVEKARQLLCFTGLQIAEVAFQSGFGSISQFNRTFRRITGISPRKFRKQHAVE